MEKAKLHQERDILRKAGKYFCQPDRPIISFQLVEDYRTEYSIRRMCTFLKLTDHRFTSGKPRALTALHVQVLMICFEPVFPRSFDEEGGLYSAKCITVPLKED